MKEDVIQRLRKCELDLIGVRVSGMYRADFSRMWIVSKSELPLTAPSVSKVFYQLPITCGTAVQSPSREAYNRYLI